jgi:hypothetical protein
VIAKRVDENQALIVQALRKVGARVQSLAMVGHGCPDLLVSRNGVNFLLEVKNGMLSPSKRELTNDERAWHDTWRGQIAVVSSIAEALAAIGVEL